MNRTIAIICFFILGFLVQAQDWTFKVDNDGYIHNWLALPAIQVDPKASNHDEGSQKELFEKEYFPRQKVITPVENDKVTVDGKELQWKTYQVEDACWNFESPANNSIYFAVTYIVASEDIPNVILSIGSDDSSKWSLNFTEVLRIYAGRAVAKDTDKSLPLTLRKGTNVLQAMIINGGGGTGLSARFIDKEGNPARNIKIASEPAKTTAVPGK